MRLTHASVFSGIGGPEIAATMLGWDNAFHCEINEFGRKILEYWYPNSRSYEDITKTDFSEWRGMVDVLTGGFPCQPFSYAGQRRGAEDDRYLWPHMFRCIDQVRPTWVVAENVAGILTMVEQGEVSPMESQGTLFDEDDGVRRHRLVETFTLQRICDDLEGHGYEVQPVLVPACAVGAPHRRDRVFIVARRIASYTDNGTDRRTAGEDESESRAQWVQERHEVRKPDEPNQVRPQAERPIADTRSCGQSASEQPSERAWQTIQSESGEQSFDGIGRPCTSSTPADTDHNGLQHDSIGREQADVSWAKSEGGQDRLSEQVQCAETIGTGKSFADTDMQRRNQQFPATEPSEEERLYCEENIDGEDIAYTESKPSERMRPQQPNTCGSKQEQPRGRGGEDGGVAGCGRWDAFPSVSPVHRGNDGLPFDVDRLTISFGKWRTESLKAYGNAIVPQVMYEIFRAIEIVERENL